MEKGVKMSKHRKKLKTHEDFQLHAADSIGFSQDQKIKESIIL